MVQDCIELTAFGTGKMISPDVVRNSLAFDMREVNFHSSVLSAVVELPAPLAARCSTARFLEPSTGRPYASASGGKVTIPLSREALRDLTDSTGAFFYCDAVLQDRAGRAVTLPPGSQGGCVLRISQRRHVAATDVHAIAA